MSPAFKNGDRLTGEIKALDRGQVSFDSPTTGVINDSDSAILASPAVFHGWRSGGAHVAIVAERYDARKELVREDAIALRTAWQRSDFLPEQDRGEAVALLREYVDLRVEFATAQTLERQGVQVFLADTQRLQNALWNMAVVNARKDMNSDVAAMYIDSLNEVNGIHAARVAVGIQARVPREIWAVLYCITLLGMVAGGYQTGVAGPKPSIARPLIGFSFALSFALVFALIAALDRPDSGLLSVTQQPLIDLYDTMTAAPERAQ